MDLSFFFNNTKYDILISIDPGLTGAIAIFDKCGLIDVCDSPVMSIPNPSKKTKKKNIFDIQRFVSLLYTYAQDSVLVAMEKVHAMKGQGTVSMFNFGVTYGACLGVIAALGYDLVKISPQSWKKYYSAFETKDIQDIKEEISALRKKTKTIKGKEDKQSNKRKIEKLNRKVKKHAKNISRARAASMFPAHKDKFKLVKHDGRADAVLIGVYACSLDQNELV